MASSPLFRLKIRAIIGHPGDGKPKTQFPYCIDILLRRDQAPPAALTKRLTGGKLMYLTANFIQFWVHFERKKMFYSNFNGTDTFDFPLLTPDPATAISNSSQPFVSYCLVSFNFCYYQVLISIVECSFWRECNSRRSWVGRNVWCQQRCLQLMTLPRTQAVCLTILPTFLVWKCPTIRIWVPCNFRATVQQWCIIHPQIQIWTQKYAISKTNNHFWPGFQSIPRKCAKP